MGENGNNLKLGLLLLGGLYLLRKNDFGGMSGTGSPQTETAMSPIAVYMGETVSADSYRRISGRRGEMDYIHAGGNLGGRITFSVPRNAVFTRNVILENGLLFAELKFA